MLQLSEKIVQSAALRCEALVASPVGLGRKAKFGAKVGAVAGQVPAIIAGLNDPVPFKNADHFGEGCATGAEIEESGQFVQRAFRCELTELSKHGCHARGGEIALLYHQLDLRRCIGCQLSHHADLVFVKAARRGIDRAQCSENHTIRGVQRKSGIRPAVQRWLGQWGIGKTWVLACIGNKYRFR